MAKKNKKALLLLLLLAGGIGIAALMQTAKAQAPTEAVKVDDITLSVNIK